MLKRLLVLILLTAGFCFPIFSHLDSLGRGDWDQFYFYSEVPQIIVYEHHQFPFWDPYYMGGVPVLGNPQTRFLSPSFIFTSLFGVVVGLKIMIIFSVFLGLVGMYLLSRYLKMGPITAFLPGMIFVFNGSLILRLVEGHFIFLPVLYLPFVFLFFLKGFDNKRYLPLGAILLALMLYQGGAYVTIFSMLSLLIYSIFRSFQLKNVVSLIHVGLLTFLALLLSAPKLFPVIDFILQHPRRTGAGAAPSLDCLKEMTLFRHGINDIPGPCLNSVGFVGWWEIGMYVGALAIVLYILSWRMFKTHGVLLLTGGVLFLIGLGNFAPWSPWAFLHQVPPFNNMHVPTRMMVVFLFYFSLMIGLYLSHFTNRIKQEWFGRIIALSVLTFISFDLLLSNMPLFYQAFTRYSASRSHQVSLFKEAPKKPPFTQVKASQEDIFSRGAWSGMHRMLLQNKGTINGYESIPVKGHAIPLTNSGYKGEFFLLNNTGSLQQIYWSPNKLAFHVNTPGEDVLVVNQNFEKNWHSSVGNVESYEGLLSLKVGPEVNDVVLWYFPNSFFYGLFALFLGIYVSWGLISGFFENKNAFFKEKIT